MTDKPKFTPGPWEVEESSDYYEVLVAADKRSVCDVLARKDTGKANAHLIEAGPDMYETLIEAKFALEVAEKVCIKNELSVQPMIDRIAAVLAKARGEE